ncbi:MAG TPA: hypothetical protein VEB22_13530 [Phycisphaerales bacterium]|nr:hypothetical protein [Phycisphaerales bacterium]
MSSFTGTDENTVVLRKACLNGATDGLRSCLSQVPNDSPPTTTPSVPPNSPALSCLLQLIQDLKACRTKYAPELPTQPSAPKKNAYDECVLGAKAKNSWCLGRKPNNPAATVALEFIEASPMAATTTSATVTFEHKNPTPINIYWYATTFGSDGKPTADLSLGMTANVASGATTLTLPITGVPAGSTDIAVFCCHTVSTDDLGVGDAAHAWFP